MKSTLLHAFLLAAVALTVQGQQVATFKSACDFQPGPPKKPYRWAAKVDPAKFRGGTVAYRLTPSQLYQWEGGRGKITSTTPRQGREKKWVEITGKVALIKIEEDGDIHVKITDADNPSSPRAVLEVPYGAAWCKFRETVLAWTKISFPSGAKTLTLKDKPVIRAVGKAFWDGKHAASAQSGGVRANKRDYDPNSSVWEVHPVMALTKIT